MVHGARVRSLVLVPVLVTEPWESRSVSDGEFLDKITTVTVYRVTCGSSSVTYTRTKQEIMLLFGFVKLGFDPQSSSPGSSFELLNVCIVTIVVSKEAGLYMRVSHQN